ncbi:hypothetical protein EPUL_001184 [Erysiphe pulchra]|uniref:Uncharacterized protein n=1 Tax=Erysiphe pulchra TaxID=225359 RepID=A0A2S4PZY9_9PEZI|nr:hypothetical protein EPUL_001184 [Erysiphe pulchra]
MARCMLMHAGLPLCFWDAAVLAASYIRNRLPINYENRSPFEDMNGRPSVTFHKKIIISANFRFHEDKFLDWEKTDSEQFVQLYDTLLEENIVVDSDSDDSLKGYPDVESLPTSSSTTSVTNPHPLPEVEPFSMNGQNSESTEVRPLPTFESPPLPEELDISQPYSLPEEITNISTSGEASSMAAGYRGILSAQDGEPLADESAYSSAVISLGYAANSTMPDISFATYQLASFNASPVARHWNSSKKQRSVATSTIDAEYIAVFEASKQAILVRRFLKELHTADQLVRNKGTDSTKAKHIDVAYHFSRSCVNDGTIKVEYIPTRYEDMRDYFISNSVELPINYGGIGKIIMSGSFVALAQTEIWLLVIIGWETRQDSDTDSLSIRRIEEEKSPECTSEELRQIREKKRQNEILEKAKFSNIFVYDLSTQEEERSQTR